MFHTVLVANRGEIAVRILRTLRELGIRSVAVHSPVDADAPHVLAADVAVPLPADDAASSYLDADAIIQAALDTGAQAIHPGYGFLSENGAFAQAVTEAGLCFIGPSAAVISQLGDKLAARQLMAAHGVPVIPGMMSADADPAHLAEAAEQIGYPLLVKAVAGGGGKGMRVVRDPADLGAALERAASEALGAFGDGTVYLERYLERPRHVEIQILADAHGKVLHLFERECSIQRRHQKLVEETPSPALDPALREAMGQAAVRAARAAGYVGAGTVEFLLDASGSFWFLEVNARLQVEHPITELTVGLDLVRWQLAIAAGEALTLEQGQLAQRGHAIECRIYAEDPAQGFLPCPGRIALLRPASGPGVRFDSGIQTGSEVPVHYDPILGKLVVHAEDRPAAIQRMRRALADNVVLGVTTTTEFTMDLMDHPEFIAGRTHTAFIETCMADWSPADRGDLVARLAWLADRGTGAGKRAAATSPQDRAWPEPWQTLGAWDLLE